MKQYKVEDAYSDNYKITMYNDGKLEFYDIVSYYEFQGYVSCLESQGYKKAYDVEEYKRKLEDAEANLIDAKKLYELALNNVLVLKD